MNLKGGRDLPCPNELARCNPSSPTSGAFIWYPYSDICRSASGRAVIGSIISIAGSIVGQESTDGWRERSSG